MHLTPHEVEKLTLQNAGLLAQRRLARGLRLNYPESVALIATVLLELIRDGKSSVTDLMEIGRKLLGRREVMSGVPEMIEEVQIEGTFPDGTKLVAVRRPITAPTGDLKLALHGSFLPIPDASLFGPADTVSETAGALITAPGDLTINKGREAITLAVTNTDTRPIQIGSHFHFVEANPRLRFDRASVRKASRHPGRHRHSLRAGRKQEREPDRNRGQPRHPRRQQPRRRSRQRRQQGPDARSRSRPLVCHAGVIVPNPAKLNHWLLHRN